MMVRHKIGTFFLPLLLAAFSWAKPQSQTSQTQSIFGDDFMSNNFHRLENVNFDNFDFMPQFDFDGFFKKVDTAPKIVEEPAQKRNDFQTRRNPAPLKDAYPTKSTFDFQPDFQSDFQSDFQPDFQQDFQSRRHQARSEDAYPSEMPAFDFQSRRHQARSEDAKPTKSTFDFQPDFQSDFQPDFQSRRHQARSEDAKPTTPTFYTNQKYSEITSPKSVRTESQFQAFPDELQDMIKEKKSRLENYAYDYEIDDFGSDFDNERYTLPYESQSIRRLDGPYDPFQSEQQTARPESTTKGRLIKVKVKKPIFNQNGKEQEDSYAEKKTTYTAEKPNWRLPIQPIEDSPEKGDYYDPPETEITVGYYEPPVKKESIWDDSPPPKEEPLNFYEPTPVRNPYKPPTTVPRPPRYSAPTYTKKPKSEFPSRVPYKPRFSHETIKTTTPPTTYAPRTPYKPPFEENPFEETSFDKTPFEDSNLFPKRRQDNFEETPFEKTPFEKTPFEKTPFEKTPFEKTPFEKTPFEKTPFVETPYDASNLFPKRRQDNLIDEKPSIFSDDPYQIPPYNPQPQYEKKPSYKKKIEPNPFKRSPVIIEERQIPPYKPRQTYQENEPSYTKRPVDIVEERQSVNSQPNFLDEPFQIPSFFRSNFDEPAFAQFNPPFGASGMFVDFLKTIGEGENQVPFAQPQLRTYVEDAPKLRENSYSDRYGSYDTEEIGGAGSPRWFSSNYKAERPSPNNGYFANDYIQDYGVKSTSTPRLKTTTTKKPTKYSNEFKPVISKKESKPKYKVVEKADPKPTYQPIEESTRANKPIKVKESPKQKPTYKTKPSSTYKPFKEPVIVPKPTYRTPEPSSKTYNRKPIQPLKKEAKPTYKTEITTTTEKPTESAVYYKPYNTEDHTPGPVYYKPLDESVSEVPKKQATPTTTTPPQTDTDSVATAPKAPPKRKLKTKKPIHPYPPQSPKRKKPFKLKFPKIKIPKLPRAQPFQRRAQPKKKKLGQPPKSTKYPQPPKKYPPPPTKYPLPTKYPPSTKRIYNPKIAPGQSRKSNIPPPPHSKIPRKKHQNILGKVKDIFSGHRHFIRERDGGPVSQSTAVLLPYVMSLL